MTEEKKPAADSEAAPPVDETETAVQPDEPTPFIVGIGASAGGLAAYEAFFKAIPAAYEPNIAFVLVQHLAPDHKSLLADIIEQYTNLPVYEIKDGTAVAPGCVYIIPPDHDLAILNGTLQLLDRVERRGINLPIDSFLRSLAMDQGDRAIGIILSGTGGDGSSGIRDIKARGGMVMAQLPDSAEYEGMPRSAIATNLVDYVLPPADMPAQLAAYVRRASGWAVGTGSIHALVQATDALQKIFVLLRNQSGHNFSQYKTNTIVRRIDRRMILQKISEIDAYILFLQKTPAEVEALFQDLLIGVTQFFRDPEAFGMLESVAIPHIFENKEPGSTIRVWVPGCATGEEAYSIAILLQEKMEALKQNYRVQLFATDIDRVAIEQARTGLYPAAIAADVSAERLARFFTQSPDESTYQIQNHIRDMLIFSEQNLIQDPPFSRLDLISCRNLLIYLDSSIQRKLISLFHYALAPDGLLFLGNSETIGKFVTLFQVLDRKWKLYLRQEDERDATGLGKGNFLPFVSAQDSVPAQRLPEGLSSVRNSYQMLAEDGLLQAYAPGSVLVNAVGEILYIHGRTGHFLEPAPGEPGMNILAMAREGLRRTLTVALHKAATQQEPVFFSGLKIKSNGDTIIANLVVRPLARQAYEEGKRPLFLITVEEVQSLSPDDALGTAVDVEEDLDLPAAGAARIAELEKELQAREEYLQSTREEMSTANEELKSTNEELQSVNEELQSTNEELETSKEELQSVNEELATVNAELQQKVADLSQANNDMSNLLSGTGVGTIFVDHQLHIMRFTPAAVELINLIQSDVGRPVGHIVSNLVGYDSLVTDIQHVLDTLVMKELEVQTKSGRWFLLGMRPYRTLENVIEGAVITFVDITRTKKAETIRHLATVVADANDAITVQDLAGQILAWNPAAARIYGWTEAEAMQMNVRDRIPAALQLEEVDVLTRLSQAEVLAPYETKRLTKDGRVLTVQLTATALTADDGDVYAIATTERIVNDN